MTVATVTAWRVAPGRNADFMELAAKGKAIQESHGGRVRLFQAALAGEATGTISFVIEHDDLAAYSAFTASLEADADWLALFATAFGADSPATMVSHSLVNELEV